MKIRWTHVHLRGGTNFSGELILYYSPFTLLHLLPTVHEPFWFCLREKKKTRKHLIVWLVAISYIYSVFKDIISSVLFLDHLNILKILCCFLWQPVAWCVDFDLKRKKKTRFYIYFPNTWCNFWFGDFPNFFNGIGLDPLPPLMTKCR